MVSNDSLSSVISSVNQLLAAAQINFKDSVSEEEESRFSKEIDSLTKIRDRIVEGEQKLTILFRNEVNSMLKTGLIGSTGTSKRQFLKRKVISSEVQEETSSKRQKLDDVAETVPFTTLPELLQDLIFEKFDYRRFTVFDDCSQFSHSMCVDTKLKFAFKNDYVEFKDERWYFQRIRGVRKDIVATTEQLKNVLLIAVSLRIKAPVNDDLCLFLTSQLKTTFLTCGEGFSCSQKLLDGLLQTFNMNKLRVNLRGQRTDYIWNVKNIETFEFSNASQLTTEVIRNLKPKNDLELKGTVGIETFLDTLNAMEEDDVVFTVTFRSHINGQAVKDAMNGRLELVEGAFYNAPNFIRCFEVYADYPSV